jgi:hypothetical protein
MNMEKYDQVIRDGYEFNFEKYMRDGWGLFKKGAGSLIGFCIIVVVMLLILNFMPFVSLISGFLQAALIAGIFIFLRQLMHKRDNFNQFFEGFNNFGQIAIFVLIRYLFIIPFAALLVTFIFPFHLFVDLMSGNIDSQYFAEEIAASLEGNIGLVIGTYVVMLMGFIYIYMSYTFTLPLIVDAKLEFWKAMEVSRKIVGRKFFMFLLLFIVLGIILGLGTAITCGLGFFIVMPYIYCVMFAAYDDILKPQSEDLSNQISEFGVQEKDINTESEDDGR